MRVTYFDLPMPPFSRLLRLGFAFLPFLVCSCTAPPEEAAPEQPNILFIMSDDHTAQAWGVYGGVLQDVAHTPNIHRLVQEGCLLRNAFATNSICVPSRAAILTGQYSHQNGVYTLSDPLDPAADHLARRMQGAGYQTAIVGKWHLQTQPSGFDHFLVLPGQGRYIDPLLRDAETWAEGGKAFSGFSADVIGDQSIAWLRQRDPDRPFFLMTHFKATHEPFYYPDRFDSLYADMVMPEPPSLTNFGRQASGRTFDGQVLEILKERYENDQAGRYPGPPFSAAGLDPVAARRKTYQKFVKDFLRSGAAIDDNIGKLLDYLEAEGLDQNTVVIYTADQGYFLGEHGFFDKRMMYEEAARMPFVVRFPPEVEAGSSNADIVLNVDFAPLILDYAGADPLETAQGHSFRANLRGQTPTDWRKDMYYRYWLHQTQRPAHLGVRTRRYKLIFFYGLPLNMTGAHQQPTPPAWEFYDLLRDPQELRNAYGMPEYQTVIDSLKERLLELRAEVGDTDEAYPEVRAMLEGGEES